MKQREPEETGSALEIRNLQPTCKKAKLKNNPWGKTNVQNKNIS